MEKATVEQRHRFLRRPMAIIASVVMSAGISTPPAEASVQQGADQEATAEGYQPEVLSASQQTESVDSPGCSPGSHITHGNTEQRWVALTIDDGPNQYDSAIMDASDANGAHGKATFFMVGGQINSNPQVAKEISDRGFGIGSHSVTHPSSASAIAAQWAPNQEIIKAYTGITPVYGRAPYLIQSTGINEGLAALGMCNISISLDSLDSRAGVVPWQQVCNNIRSAKPGDIILFHSKLQTSIAFQNCVFDILKELNLEPMTIHELLTGVRDMGTRVPAGGKVEIQAGAPNQSVAGVLTATGEQGSGFLTAYPCSEGKPESSDLNFVANESTANLLLVKLDEQGKFCVSVHDAATHILFDKTAEVPAEQLPLHKAERKFDSRSGPGKPAAGSMLRLVLAGPDEIVVGQVTNDQAKNAGFVTIFTCDTNMPETSNLNFVPGQPTANRFIAKGNSNGEVCFYTSEETHLIVDQSAELNKSSLAFDPSRLLDTRPGEPLQENGTIAIDVGAPYATAFVQATIANAQGDGFETLFPCDQGLQVASNVNFGSDRTRSSSAVVSGDSNGQVCAYVSEGADVIVDGLATASWPSQAPVRLLDTRTN